MLGELILGQHQYYSNQQNTLLANTTKSKVYGIEAKSFILFNVLKSISWFSNTCQNNYYGGYPSHKMLY